MSGTTNAGLASYHRLFKTNKSSDHKQQIVDDRRSECQGEAGKGGVHVRENCDEADTADDYVGKDVETGGDPPVYLKKR